MYCCGRLRHGAGLFLADDLPFKCFCWIALEKSLSALQNRHRELMQRLQTYHPAECCISSLGPLTSACEAHLRPLHWSMHSEWGPLLTSKWVRKQNCASASLCSFELYCVEWTKPPRCDVREQWWQYMAPRQPGVKWVTSAFSLWLWTQLLHAWHSSRSRHRVQ